MLFLYASDTDSTHSQLSANTEPYIILEDKKLPSKTPTPTCSDSDEDEIYIAPPVTKYLQYGEPVACIKQTLIRMSLEKKEHDAKRFFAKIEEEIIAKLQQIERIYKKESAPILDKLEKISAQALRQKIAKENYGNNFHIAYLDPATGEILSERPESCRYFLQENENQHGYFVTIPARPVIKIYIPNTEAQLYR